MLQVNAGFVGCAHAEPGSELRRPSHRICGFDEIRNQPGRKLRMAIGKELFFFGGWRIAHLKWGKTIELRGIDAERGRELLAAIDRGNELNVVRHRDENVLDG